MKVKKLITADFLNRAAQELPAEFLKVSLSACHYARVAVDHIGKTDQVVTREARGQLGTHYEFLLAAAKARKFAPAKAIGPFEIVNFLIR